MAKKKTGKKKIKRTAVKTKSLTCTEFFSVKLAGEGVFLEGFANKRTVDRSTEIFAKMSWNLDNFKKNPVILSPA